MEIEINENILHSSNTTSTEHNEIRTAIDFREEETFLEPISKIW